jgi:NAD(P)H-flavin reductase
MFFSISIISNFGASLTFYDHRLRIARAKSVEYPTKPQNGFLQSYATATAIARELVNPEVHFKNRWFSWLSPPPLGRSILILSYLAVILYMLLSDSIVKDAYYWERIGFRAAWISVTQVPFVFLLASKSSIIGVLSGSSHERLNFLHRWVSRTLLFTVTIHGSFFYREWAIAEFVAFELQMMPMVKYGMGAWFVLLWTFISSLTPIRRLSYEVFVLQHLAAACVFLWLIYVHVPAYAQYNVWWAIAAIVFDKLFLLCWTLWANVSIRSAKGSAGRTPKKIGHHAELRALDDETTEVIVKDIGFSWYPGQHIYLRLPSVGPTEAHPFTIANVCKQTTGAAHNDIQLIIQAQTGFTRRLYRKAKIAAPGSHVDLTAIVTGPLGAPPAWNSFETLVLISASTGASFTIPILESILSSRNNSCVSRIDVLMIVRRRCGIEYYLPRLEKALEAAREVGLQLKVTVSITGESDDSGLAEIMSHDEKSTGLRSATSGCQCGVDEIESGPSSSSSSSSSTHKDSATSTKVRVVKEKEVKSCCCGIGKDKIMYSCGRPDLAGFVRTAVEATGGETSVAVCGGNSLVAAVRNDVASLSNERAVHKGTGAQGIHLHAEHYCF